MRFTPLAAIGCLCGILACPGTVTDNPPTDDAGTVADGGSAAFDAGQRAPPPAPWVNQPLQLPIGTWVQLSPAPNKPSPRFLYEGGAAWDPFTKRLVHHAGHDGIPQGHHVFTFDPIAQTWLQVFPASSPPGACLVEGSMAFDLGARRAYRWPALSLNHGSAFSREIKLKRSWMWLFDAATGEWSNMRPPPYRAGDGTPVGAPGSSQAALFDARRGLGVSHGGQGTPVGQLTFYDAYDNSIERVTSAANAPSQRDNHGFAFDAVHDQYLVWGAQYSADSALYVFHSATQTWEKKTTQNPPPSAVEPNAGYSSMPRMACDGMTTTCVVVGRNSMTGAMFTSLLDTNTFTWTHVTTAQPTSLKTRAFNLMYAPDLNAYLLELQTTMGGVDQDEIWAFRVEEAPRPQGPAAPPSLSVESTTTTAKLEWLPSAEATAYRVYKGSSVKARAATLTLLTQVTETTFEDPAPSTTEPTFYEVRSVDAAGAESVFGPRARSQPRVPSMPVVKVNSATDVTVSWAASSGSDVVGFNVYRGVATVSATDGGEAVTTGYGYNNDVAYDSPRVTSVQDITGVTKLNGELLTVLTFHDTTVNLLAPTAASGGYPFAVHAYVVRSVNALGIESGPSPYQLTIPSPPRRLMTDDTTLDAVLRWEAPSEGAQRYRIYQIPTSGRVSDVTPAAGQTTLTATIRAAPQGSRYSVTAIDVLGQEGQPSSPTWFKRSYRGFFTGPWHQ